jgi:hypothetical protein
MTGVEITAPAGALLDRDAQKNTPEGSMGIRVAGIAESLRETS